MNQNTILTPKTAKVRTKQTPVRPAGPNIKVGMGQAAGNVQQVVTSAGNKWVFLEIVLAWRIFNLYISFLLEFQNGRHELHASTPTDPTIDGRR